MKTVEKTVFHRIGLLVLSERSLVDTFCTASCGAAVYPVGGGYPGSGGVPGVMVVAGNGVMGVNGPIWPYLALFGPI